MEHDLHSQKLENPIDQARITAGMDVDSLINSISGCAFGAGKLADAVDIYHEMLSEGSTSFFGLAGAMVPAGMRSIVTDLIRDGYIDVLVTTGANMVHEIVESLGLHHYKGCAECNDIELKHDEINRIYDVYLPETYFVDFEEKMQAILSGLGDDTISIRELMTHIGRNIDDDNSILKAAADMNVPVYCPAIQDSMIGLQAWLYKQKNPLKVDAFADMKEIIDICYESKKPGALLIGGGVPKNYIFQSMLITHQEFEYAIQLTMDTPETGGLSGATLDEARSWGKVSETARSVTVHSDATITLPILVAAARSRLAKE
ncbi:deoxyhypusine synthase [Methanolobus halotolerans]|uniref:Probable deoxyhypusine synthase n=1 Tax=Methanolobus halotolerans TaxID=2052935 RepID=A0A4E0R2G3_9EURY|nr:deoxyhypusine synthase [Methanolobus halotolerans]TGC11593.1 deoxyhypusine synthase [Methanolobus halotolerans]